jgi:hypothetical protein
MTGSDSGVESSAKVNGKCNRKRSTYSKFRSARQFFNTSTAVSAFSLKNLVEINRSSRLYLPSEKTCYRAAPISL